MFSIKMDVFLQRPNEVTARVLHRSSVCDLGEGVSVRPADATFAAADGDPLSVYYEVDRRFMKVAARVTGTTMLDGDRVITLTIVGEPVSADSRECYRVTTVTDPFQITVDKEQCSLTDISVMGFSIISGQGREIGDTVAVSLHYDGRVSRGQGRVQSVKTLPDGRYRLGILCTDDHHTGRELRRGLHRMSMDLQRWKLRRRSA